MAINKNFKITDKDKSVTCPWCYQRGDLANFMVRVKKANCAFRCKVCKITKSCVEIVKAWGKLNNF